MQTTTKPAARAAFTSLTESPTIRDSPGSTPKCEAAWSRGMGSGFFFAKVSPLMTISKSS